MRSKTRETDDLDPSRRSSFLDESLTRRNLARLAGVTAGLATLAPAMARAQTPAASPAAPSTLGTPSPDRPRGGSVTVARAGDSDSLDPAHTTAGISFQVFNNIYDTLVGYNAELTYEGILAESWDISKDGLTYTFHLRKGITFHDGTEFNADAVKFTFDRLMDPKTAAPAAGWVTAIKSTTVIDPSTVAINLSTPFSPLLGNIALSYFGIVSPTAVQKYGDDFSTNPVGTGPWKFKEWVQGDHITLVPNENYQNFHSYMENHGAPYLDELTFSNIGEAQTQLAALQTNQVQIIPVPPTDLKQLQSDSSYQVVIPPRNTDISFLEFAMEKIDDNAVGATWKAPFDDIRLRQAVGYALDVDTMIKNILFGLATRNYGPMPTGMFAYDPSIEQYGFHYDPDKAKSLLDAAGWTQKGNDTREKDGKKLELEFWTYSQDPNDKISQVIQNQLAAVGVSVKITLLEVATFLAQLQDGGSNFDLDGWGWPEPHLLKMMVSSTAGVGYYHDKDYEALVDKASETSDLKERTDLYFQASQKMLADAAMIPLWTSLSATAIRAEAKGYNPTPQGYGAYEDMYFEK